MGEFCIGHRVLRTGDKPYIIAEIGVNYENDIELAAEMIRRAARAGADAVKFQTYKAEKLAAADSPTYWDEKKTQREFFKQYDKFGEAEYRYLAQVCEAEHITFVSTPFDKEAVDFLEPLVPVYKVASADITNLDLLRYIARKRKPVILSTGASTLSEIARAVEILNENGVEQVALLHCVLHYPTDYTEANLLSIPYLKKCFPEHIVGYSDHTKPDPGMAVVTAAAILGATIIEKHFTLDKSKVGNDHYHAMDPSDLILLIRNISIIWDAFGCEDRHISPGELAARKYARRSLVAAKNIKKGTRIQTEDLTCKRPCTGIPAEDFAYVVGRIAKQDIVEDTILQWSLLD